MSAVLTSACSIAAGEQGLDASDLAADPAGLVGLGQLAGGLLHAQGELFLAQLAQVGVELLGRLLAQFLDGH